MANQQRIFYACQAVAIAPRGTGTLTSSHIVEGAQSVGMSSTFTLDQVFELGQIEIYENVEMMHKGYENEQIIVELGCVVSLAICIGLHGSILGPKKYPAAFR